MTQPARAVADALAVWPGAPLAVAVSGGSDSMALLELVAEVRAQDGRTVHAITVDHGLRPESTEEARFVALQCERHGIPHETLEWEGWSGQGNLQQEARRARQRLIGAWAPRRGIGHVLLGHTADDQAETVLLRLARGSGVYGLAAMDDVSRAEGVLWLRPMLTCRREDLRKVLNDKGVDWREDPSNADQRFDRVKFRQALPLLADLGLSVDRLAGTAAAMGRAAEVVRGQVLALARAVAQPHAAGFVRLHRREFREAPEELRLRLLAAATQWVAPTDHPPRLSALCALDTAAAERADTAMTLHNCLVSLRGDAIEVVREPQRVCGAVRAGEVWDGRWQTRGPEDLRVAALGEAGLAQLDNWRAAGLPRPALLSLPAFWDNGGLIAAPFALPGQACNAHLINGPAGFFDSLTLR